MALLLGTDLAGKASDAPGLHLQGAFLLDVGFRATLQIEYGDLAVVGVNVR